MGWIDCAPGVATAAASSNAYDSMFSGKIQLFSLFIPSLLRCRSCGTCSMCCCEYQGDGLKPNLRQANE